MSISKARFLVQLKRRGNDEHGRRSIPPSRRAEPRRTRWTLASAVILATSLLTACASRNTPPAPLPVVQRIRVLPVMPIDRLYTENKGIPIGVLWQAISDRVKSNNFTDLMDATRKNMATRMTAALLLRLKEQGYDAQVLEGVERPAASPDNVDYTRIPGTDPVLHVYFSTVGMYSSRFSRDYVPRVNVGAELLRPRDEESIYSESIYYGADADASKVTSWSVPAQGGRTWTSFDEMVQKSAEVTQSYEEAVEALAAKIASNIRARTAAP